MNLPNKLTLARIAMVPVFAVLAELAANTHRGILYFLAGAVFGIASLTDMLDGRIARGQGLVTNFGKFADPLADKILTTAAFLYLQFEGVCPPAVLILILFREFAVSGLRMLSAGAPGGKVIPANIWGKLKTTFQMITILVFYFLSALFPESAILRTAVTVLCWASAGITLASGWTYFAGSRDLLSDLK